MLSGELRAGTSFLARDVDIRAAFPGHENTKHQRAPLLPSLFAPLIMSSSNGSAVVNEVFIALYGVLFFTAIFNVWKHGYRGKAGFIFFLIFALGTCAILPMLLLAWIL